MHSAFFVIEIKTYTILFWNELEFDDHLNIISWQQQNNFVSKSPKNLFYQIDLDLVFLENFNGQRKLS